MSGSSAGYIDEYNQLRGEIRMYLEHGHKSLQLVMALGAAAVTFGSNYPDLLLVSALIVAYVWYDEIRHLRAVQRTASYLEVFVEPNVEGLQWETTNQSHSFTRSYINRAIGEAPFPTLVLALTLYGFHRQEWPMVWGSVACVVPLIVLFRLSYIEAVNGRDRERGRWELIRATASPEREKTE